MSVKLTLLPTLNSLIASFPLIVTDCPVPSRTVSVVIPMVFVNTMTPLQANDTLPPPANAASRLAWSQDETVPLAHAVLEIDSRKQNPISSQTKNRDKLPMGRWRERLEGSSDEWRFPRRSENE